MDVVTGEMSAGYRPEANSVQQTCNTSKLSAPHGSAVGCNGVARVGNRLLQLI
jgi:hypothetical protein